VLQVAKTLYAGLPLSKDGKRPSNLRTFQWQCATATYVTKQPTKCAV